MMNNQDIDEKLEKELLKVDKEYIIAWLMRFTWSDQKAIILKKLKEEQKIEESKNS